MPTVIRKMLAIYLKQNKTFNQFKVLPKKWKSNSPVVVLAEAISKSHLCNQLHLKRKRKEEDGVPIRHLEASTKIHHNQPLEMTPRIVEEVAAALGQRSPQWVDLVSMRNRISPWIQRGSNKKIGIISNRP